MTVQIKQAGAAMIAELIDEQAGSTNLIKMNKKRSRNLLDNIAL